MQAVVFWLMPIVLLPGVALLIMSTSLRFGQIHEELHHILYEEEVVSSLYISHLRRRSTLFRDALVSLYVSVGSMAIGSIIGALVELLGGPAEWYVIGFSLLGIICLVLAAVFLIRESVLSLVVVEHHLEMLAKD